MKKITLLFVFLFGIMTATCFAQEDCKMCGDWVGVYESSKMHPTEDRLIPADWKMYIRIKKIDGFYNARVKTRIADNSMEYVYWTDWKMYQAYDNKIILRWEVKDDKVYDDVYFTLTYNQGILYFDGGTIHRTYYANKSKQTLPAPFSPVTLYKEENDW